MNNYFIFECDGLIQGVLYLELSLLHLELSGGGTLFSDYMVVF